MVIEIKVPDIGNFDTVDVIEVLINIGDEISIDQTLLTLESDKASMDVPADVAGKITQVLVKVGDKIKEGDVIALLELADAKTSSPTQASIAAPTVAEAVQVPDVLQVPAALPVPTNADCDVLVLGAGPGGYSAAFRAADLGLKVIMIERFPTLGGVCLNVGCIPSKALLHVVKVTEEAQQLAAHGISFGKPVIDLDKLRGFKESVVSRLTGGLAAMAKMRKVEVVQGEATFIDTHNMAVKLNDGSTRNICFDKAIIAAGSRPVHLPFMPENDPRIVDSTGALKMDSIPETMLVIGGGIIGLEMATVYSILGTKVSIVEFTDGFVPGADRDLAKVYETYNKNRFEKLMFKTKVITATATDAGIEVTFEGENAPSTPQTYAKVLVAVGRAPNGKLIGAQNAGITVDERGFIPVDLQMRTNQANIFAIGDIVGQPMLAHKAVHEAHVAAEVCKGLPRFFDVKQIPSVAYADPEMAWTGLTETEAKLKNIAYEKAVFPWAASGKAIAHGRDEGFTKLLFDPDTHRLVGGGVVGANAGDLIGEIALAIEMGADAMDIARTIHPHPTLIESVGMAAEVFEGSCTDLPPVKKK
ncbi:dihydrolipoyl dehydrogenase [Gammaproteobacteria bacterium]|nr:dihydrolipoyl dehydrogenase [Gammaproteobacteria bacterium]